MNHARLQFRSVRRTQYKSIVLTNTGGPVPVIICTFLFSLPRGILVSVIQLNPGASAFPVACCGV
jgi:hypothetical protein